MEIVRQDTEDVQYKTKFLEGRRLIKINPR